MGAFPLATPEEPDDGRSMSVLAYVSDMAASRTLAGWSLLGLLGAGVLLGLTVYPFDYGVVESALVAGLFVAVALFEFVLDSASV